MVSKYLIMWSIIEETKCICSGEPEPELAAITDSLVSLTWFHRCGHAVPPGSDKRTCNSSIFRSLAQFPQDNSMTFGTMQAHTVGHWIREESSFWEIPVFYNGQQATLLNHFPWRNRYHHEAKLFPKKGILPFAGKHSEIQAWREQAFRSNYSMRVVTCKHKRNFCHSRCRTRSTDEKFRKRHASWWGCPLHNVEQERNAMDALRS